MQLRCYTIFDCKALQYHSPWSAVSDGSAIRMFEDLANDLNTTIGRHPKDYTLWLCGSWDDNAGVFTPVSPLVHVIDAIALVREARQGALPLAALQEADERQVRPSANGRD